MTVFPRHPVCTTYVELPSLNHGSAGVGAAEGKVCFVPFSSINVRSVISAISSQIKVVVVRIAKNWRLNLRTFVR